MPALAALTNQDTFEAPQTAACLPLKLCLWTEVISCYSQGKKRSLLPPPLYPHRLSFISFPARESQRHSNQNLCKLTPNVTQYYKGRKMLIFFFFSPLVSGCWLHTQLLQFWFCGIQDSRCMGLCFEDTKAQRAVLALPPAAEGRKEGQKQERWASGLCTC